MGARYEHMNMEAMRKVMPEKARLMDEIFGYRINGLCKPTYNKTTRELSNTLTHVNYTCPWDNSDYIMERDAIIKSCEYNLPTYNSHAEHGTYCFVEDLDISILQSIKYIIGDTPYYDWLRKKHEEEEKVKILEQENALIKEKLEKYKTQLEAIKAITV